MKRPVATAHRYARGYSWGFSGRPLPRLAPEEWLVGYHDGFAAAVAILREDELR